MTQKVKAGEGFVVRNDQGLTIGAGAGNLDGATISIAEAVALKKGILFARKKDI